MEFSVQNLCGFLIRSKLMAPEGMRAMHQRWQAEAKDQAGSTSQFTKWLVANKYVTEYQANLLAKGHADDFFVNEYMILERLGRGRMAGVYRAAHPLGQEVAIKVLPPSRAKNPQVLARFQREAELSIKLKHPNVVRTFQVGHMSGLHYLVMEYLEGETLDEVLQRRKRLPLAEAVRLVHQALTGLQHIHDLGMVHRDLKPANLMLAPIPGPNEPDVTLQATVKILDIGLARQLFEEGHPPPDQRPELTAEGVLLGTPDYLAPEQARDPRSIDIRADIYSLGCVLYHAITGQPPFPDTNILSQMVKHATEAPRPLKDFNPQTPDGLQQIADWMMAKKPEDRYPTPSRAAQALQMFLMADNVPARRLDDAPQMRKYLTWLEKGQPSEADTVNLPPPAAAPKPSTNPPFSAPAAKPTAPPRPEPVPTNPDSKATAHAEPLGAVRDRASRKTPRPPHHTDKKRKRLRERKALAVAPGAAPLAARVPTPETAAPPPSPLEFDVELVPAEQLTTSRDAPKKRDWLLIAIGGGVLFLLLVAILLLVVILTR